MRSIVSQVSLALALVGILVLLGVFPHLQTVKSAGCSSSSLRGTYGWIGHGDKGGTPEAIIGREIFDGAGFTYSDVTSSVGGKSNRDKFKGIYTINSDCAGTMIVAFPDNSRFHFDLVVVDGGLEVYWIITDSGFTLSGITKRM